MAYIEGSKTFSVGGYGTASGYTSCRAVAKLEASTSGGKLDWKITMTTTDGSGGTPCIYLYFYIGDTKIYDGYYSGTWNAFPRGNGTSDSGSVNITANANVSKTLTLKVGVAQRSCQYSDAQTISRKYYTAGTAPTVSITGGTYGKTFTISGRQGTSGTNNPIQSTVVYYTTNGTTPTFENNGKPGTGTSKITFGASSNAAYSKSIPPSVSNSYTVKAIARSAFMTPKPTSGHQWSTAQSGTVSKAITYWINAEVPTIQSIVQNTMGTEVTVTYRNGLSGTNNGIKSSTLFYTTDGTTPTASSASVALNTTSGILGQTKTLTGFTRSCTLKAIIRNIFEQQTKWSDVVTLGTTYRTEGTVPASLTITNNKNNTVTISGYQGRSGTNNDITSSTLYYKINGAASYSSKTIPVSSGVWFGGGSYTFAISKNCTVSAYIVSTFQYGNDKRKDATNVTISYYANPLQPTVPYLTAESYSNNRLTIKKPWTFSWTCSGSFAGYRVCVFKGDKTTYQNYRITSSGWTNKDINGALCLDKDSSATTETITFDPISSGFKPGEQFWISVDAYNKNGKGEQIFNDPPKSALSDVYLVQNSGIMRVKVNNTWKEGQVWIKTANGWKEADSVHVKTSAGWKESQ